MRKKRNQLERERQVLLNRNKALALLSKAKKSTQTARQHPRSLLSARDACERTLDVSKELQEQAQSLEERQEVVDSALSLVYKMHSALLATQRTKVYGADQFTSRFW